VVFVVFVARKVYTLVFLYILKKKVYTFSYILTKNQEKPKKIRTHVEGGKAFLGKE